MSEEDIKNIIFDLYLVMRFKGYHKLTILNNVSLEVDVEEITFPVRAKHAFSRLNIKNLDDALWMMKDEKRVKNLRGFGIGTVADTKNAILMWHINENFHNGRKPLYGIRLS